jgi:hypothetical protein
MSDLRALLKEALPYVDAAAPRSTGRTPGEIARDIKREIGHAEVGWSHGVRAFCEAEMRRLTNGDRGCSDPEEHRRA